jgi:hypothetical protein
VAEIRAQDVGQFHDQLVDFGAEFLCLLILQGLPGVLKQPERHRLVAVDDLPVALQRGAQTAQAFLQQLVILCTNAGGAEIAKLRQRPGRTFRDQLADFPLEPAGMLSCAFSVAVRRDFLERAIEQGGKRLHRLSVAPCANEHEWEIVAQRREIAVSGEKRRLQVTAGKRIALALGHSAREMKRDVRLKFYLHAEIALVFFV